MLGFPPIFGHPPRCEDTAGACESISDFNVSVGHLALRGPNKQETRMVTIGEDLVYGFWFRV